MEENRRAFDGTGERLIKLEVDFDHVKGKVDDINQKLDEHIDNNAKGFEELRGHMSSLANSSMLAVDTFDRQSRTMDGIANTLKEFQKNEFKVSSLEEWKSRVDIHLGQCDSEHESTKEKLTKTDEMVRRIYWIVPLAMCAIGFAIELIDTFHLIK